MMEKKSLLVVDNTTTLASPWKNDVRKYFNCMEVVGGFEAISKLKNNDITGIIVNLSIRTFNGLDVVIKIRDNYKSIPMLIIADKTDLRFVKNAAQFGIHGYFLYPVDSNALLNNLQKIIGIDFKQIDNQLAQEETQKIQANKEKEKKISDNEDDIPSLYYEGQSFLLHEKIDEAVGVFNKILNTKKFKDTWRKYLEDSLYQIGRCFIKMGQYKEAIDKFNQFIQKAPNSELHKNACYLVGECYENLNDINKAVIVFKKLIDMPPFDSVSTQARKKVKSLQK